MITYLQFQKDLDGLRDVTDMVKTIEKIAASRLMDLRRSLTTIEAYTTEIRAVLAAIRPHVASEANPLLMPRPDARRILLVLGGDQGLVGGMYHGLVDTLLPQKDRYRGFVVVGKTCRRFLTEEGIETERFFSNDPATPAGDVSNTISSYILGRFAGEPVSFDVLYPKFVSFMEHTPTLVPLLPFPLPDTPSAAEDIGFPLFEPAKNSVFAWVLNAAITSTFTGLVAETRLSELSARTLEMEHAAEKARHIARGLMHEFHKTRRKIATQRQLESFIVHTLV
ncbi:F0F1 ATP synthase subunit gamma [Patescibacteria group bacterium]|nr:F0F1 ATP synthase subunit gamma [Patescibacteria group bacterium]